MTLLLNNKISSTDYFFGLPEYLGSIKMSFYDTCQKIYAFALGTFFNSVEERSNKKSLELVNRVDSLITSNVEIYKIKSSQLSKKIDIMEKNRQEGIVINSTGLKEELVEKFQLLSEDEKEEAVKEFIIEVKFNSMITTKKHAFGAKKIPKIPKIAIDRHLLETFKNTKNFDSKISGKFFVMFIDAIESVANSRNKDSIHNNLNKLKKRGH